MAYIKIKLDAALMDGHNVTFKAPCDCTAIEGLKVCYIENNSLQEKIFTMKDTHGNALAGLGNLFVEGAYVHAVLDSVNLIAYLLNADTNGYLERKINSVENAIAADHARIEDLVKNQIPEEYLHACVEDYINENDATLATKEEINYISSDVSNVVDFSNVNFATDKYRTYIYYNSANEVYRDGNITGYTNESNYIAYLVPIDETWCYVTYEWEDPINSKEGASIFWRTLSEKPYDNAPKNITINTFDYLKAVDNTTKMRVREIPTGTKYILFEVRKNNSDYSVEDALGKFKICKGSVYIPNDLCDKTVLNIGRTKYIESIGKNIINADYRLNDAFHTLDSEIVSSELGTREFYLAGATTLETYARIDEALLKCGRNYTKELIGYASDIDGNNNTELPIYCYHLRSNIYFPNWSHSNQETLLVVGSIHGDEKLSTYAIYKMIEEINGCNSILNSVLCSFNIDFVPIANPYGYDMMQRRNARGVDINRNFTSGWNEFKEKFDNGEMKAYYNCGVAPLSEKESQALQSLIDRNKNNYVALVDVHNRGLNDDFGASAVLYQIYSNNVELRKKVIRKIANIDSVWREEYGYSLLENQYDEKNGSIMEIEGGINSNLPQLVNEFSLICDTDVCCDIELPWAFYEDGTPKWRFAHPFQLIAVDGYINTLLGIAKYLE